MQPHETTLDAALTSGPPGIVAITGAGGKTGLLFFLARSLAQREQAVICTTTTRMLLPEPEERLTVTLADEPAVRPVPGTAVFYARPAGSGQDTSKVYGYSPAQVDEMGGQASGTWVLVEADGAARLSLKAPAGHEPAVPPRAGVVVAVVGLGAFGRPFDEKTVFRADEFAAITGLAKGDAITPEAVAPLIRHPHGWFKNCPPSAKRYLLCNQADGSREERVASRLAECALASCPGFLDGFLVAAVRKKGGACLSFPVK